MCVYIYHFNIDSILKTAAVTTTSNGLRRGGHSISIPKLVSNTCSKHDILPKYIWYIIRQITVSSCQTADNNEENTTDELLNHIWMVDTSEWNELTRYNTMLRLKRPGFEPLTATVSLVSAHNHNLWLTCPSPPRRPSWTTTEQHCHTYTPDAKNQSVCDPAGKIPDINDGSDEETSLAIEIKRHRRRWYVRRMSSCALGKTAHARQQMVDDWLRLRGQGERATASCTITCCNVQ